MIDCKAYQCTCKVYTKLYKTLGIGCWVQHVLYLIYYVYLLTCIHVHISLSMELSIGCQVWNFCMCTP